MSDNRLTRKYLLQTNGEAAAKAFSFSSEMISKKFPVRKESPSQDGPQSLCAPQVGVRKNAVVFFSDIRNFTSFSDSHSPEEVVSMLNEYFAVMVRIIVQNQGVVDKFNGDSIMAVWGTGKTTGKEAFLCLKACLEMRMALRILNERRVRNREEPLTIGMGVASGTVISGTVGSIDHMEHTVIGEAVNLASRMESSTKSFGIDLLINEETAKQIDSGIWLEKAGTVTVKGKTQLVTVYKVRGYVDEQGGRQEVVTEYSDYNPEQTTKITIVSRDSMNLL